MEVLSTSPDSIIVEDRERKVFSGIEELATSIKEHGLIHPIRVTKELKLIAGERRLRACKLAGVNVDYIVKENCSAIELKELELRENLDREDMTWQERASGLAALDALKKAEHGEAWGVRDTAALVSDSKSAVSRAVQITKAMEVFPELAQAKTQDEAHKKLKKINEALIISELVKRQKAEQAKAVEETKNPFLVYAERDFKVSDAFAGLKAMPSESFDFANVDTPYGIDLTDQKKIQTSFRTDEQYQEWSRESYVPSITAIANECYRILKPDTWMTFWFGQEWYSEVLTVLKSAGFGVDKIPAIWYGGAGAAQTIATEVNLGRCYEPFFICRKGQPLLLRRGRPNVFPFDKLAAQSKIHPTEKPVTLMKDIYETFLLPGKKILVPFIGSGNDLRAAYMHGCLAEGHDLNQDVKNRFMLRVEEDFNNGLYK